MTEEFADKAVRGLIATIPILVILVAFLVTFAFPRGIRITLGRRTLWLAPPASLTASYFRLAAHYRQTSAEGAALLAEMRDIHVESDRLLARVAEDFPELAAAGRIEVSHDPAVQVLVALLIGVENDARLHFEAFQKYAERADELLAQPAARTVSELLLQDSDRHTNMRLAWLATTLRVSSLGEGLRTAKRALQPLKDTALQQDARKATIDAISAVLQALGDQVGEIGDEIAQVEQPGRRPRGRPPAKEWSDDEIRGLHAAYQARGEQKSRDFAKGKGLSESGMFRLFRRVGISKKGPGNFDSEL